MHAANAAVAAAAAACAAAQRFQTMVLNWMENPACPAGAMIDEGWSAEEHGTIKPTWSTKTRHDWYIARHRHMWKEQAEWSPPTTTPSS